MSNENADIMAIAEYYNKHYSNAFVGATMKKLRQEQSLSLDVFSTIIGVKTLELEGYEKGTFNWTHKMIFTYLKGLQEFSHYIVSEDY